MSCALLLRGVSAGSLSLALLAAAHAQESLPTIDVGAAGPGRGQSEQRGDGSFGPGGRHTGYSATNAKSTLKTDTPLLKTPLSVQVVTREIMDDRQAVSLADAVIQNVSGVSLGYQFYDSFVIRGFNANGAFYRNGLRFTNLSNLETSNLQSIDILKGPASMLFGRVEPGGLVNLAPKRPQSTPYYSIQEQAGLFGFTRTMLDMTGPLNEDKTLAYRLNISYLNSDSFRDFANKENFLVSPVISWRPDESFTLNVEGEYQKSRWVDDLGDVGIPAIGNRPANIPISRYLSDPSITSRYKNGQERALFAYDWTYRFLENWSVTNRFAYSSVDLPQHLNYAPRIDETTGVMQRATWHMPVGNREFLSTNVDLKGKVETGPLTHQLLVGFDYFNFKQIWDGADFLPVPSINIYNPIYAGTGLGAITPDYAFYQSRKDKWTGLYVQDQISFWDDRIQILLGGRHDWAETSTANSNASLAAADARRVVIPTSANSPLVGLLIQPLPWLSVYGNYTRSYGASNGTSNNAPLPPQAGTQFEGGVKAELLDGRLTATFAYFDVTKTNITRPIPGTNFVRPIGEANSNGVEFDLKGRIDDNWSLIATYSHMEAQITKDEDKKGSGGLTGKYLASVPRNAANLWVKYDADGMWKGLALGAGIIYVDKRFGDDANTYELPAYARVDTLASYKFNAGWMPGAPDLTLQVNVKNLLGTTYYESSSTRMNAVPGAPRWFMASIRAEF
jgi:iron complex outermembrane receptor protein